MYSQVYLFPTNWDELLVDRSHFSLGYHYTKHELIR